MADFESLCRDMCARMGLAYDDVMRDWLAVDPARLGHVRAGLGPPRVSRPEHVPLAAPGVYMGDPCARCGLVRSAWVREACDASGPLNSLRG